MEILSTIVTVLFFILCLLLVVMILLQTDKSAGMGILGGSSQSTFGSSTADVVTKITAVMVGMFLVGALLLAFFNRYGMKSIENELISGSGKAVKTTAPLKPDAKQNTAEPAAPAAKEAAPSADSKNTGN